MDDKTLVEPSNDEQSQWPEATEAYVRGLEEQNEAQATHIEALEAALRDAAKAERDRLRELLQSEAIRGRIGNALDNSKGMLHSYKISVIVEALTDALESKP